MVGLKILEKFWATRCPLARRLRFAMSVPALSCAHLDDIKHNSAEFSKVHPMVDAAKLSWGERVFDRQARDAYTMACFDSEAIGAVRRWGARPCIRCGDFTSAWCEGCQMPSPMAMCSECDRQHILCPACVASGKLWSVVKSQTPSDTMEITGYMNTKNQFQEVNPPLHLRTAEIPKIDGVYDMAYITQRILEYEEETSNKAQAAAVPKTGPGTVEGDTGSNASGWLGTATPPLVVSKAPPKAPPTASAKPKMQPEPTPTPPGLH